MMRNPVCLKTGGHQKFITLPETNSSDLKMDGWKMIRLDLHFPLIISGGDLGDRGDRPDRGGEVLEKMGWNLLPHTTMLKPDET